MVIQVDRDLAAFKVDANALFNKLLMQGTLSALDQQMLVTR